jgi:serine/threonine-protein kinase
VAEDALVGQTLTDKYRVLRQIGRGGMGVVYEAEHVELGKRVAIKLMLEKYAEDAEATQRFKREALAASRIGNPHIIDISDIGTAPDGRMFVVMELLHGEPLADAMKRTGALPVPRVTKIIRQVLRAVGAAHGKSIIHRDLKPDNIFLVGDEDHVKLLDFGISKVLDSSPDASTRLTSTGAVMGTPLYMAPEQAMGEPTDHRADIYALGVILYEMLAGRPPFEGSTYGALITKVLTSDAPLLSDLKPSLPRSLVAATHRALEKEPARRFASCAEMSAAIAGTTERAAVDEIALSSTSMSTPRLALDQTMPSGERPAVVAANVVTTEVSKRSNTPIIVGALGGGLLVAVVAIVVLAGRGGDPVPPPAASGSAVAVASGSAMAAAPIDAAVPVAIDAPVQVAVAATEAPAPTSSTPKPSPPPKTTKPTKPATLAEVNEAVKRRDGKKCRALLAAVPDAPTSYPYLSAKAVCEMLAGNCEGGIKIQKELYKRDGTPEESANIVANIWCPPGDDPAVRLKRISTQMSMFSKFDCAYYLKHTRKAVADATTDGDKHTVGVLLAQIATCFSHKGDCDQARSVLAEAQVFIPKLGLSELNAKCR